MSIFARILWIGVVVAVLHAPIVAAHSLVSDEPRLQGKRIGVPRGQRLHKEFCEYCFKLHYGTCPELLL